MRIKYEIICFSFFIIFLTTNYSFTQEYQEFDTLSRNDFIIHGGVGLGLCAFKHNDPNSEALLTTSRIIDLGASYFIAEKIYIGFTYNRLAFANNLDSSESARCNLLGLTIRYQTLKGAKTNIYVGLTTGTSSFKYKDLTTNTYATAGSIFLEPNIGFTHFWGKRIGMFIQSSYFYTKYNKIVNKDNEPLRVIINGKKENLWLSFSGMKLQSGLLFKF